MINPQMQGASVMADARERAKAELQQWTATVKQHQAAVDNGLREIEKIGTFLEMLDRFDPLEVNQPAATPAPKAPSLPPINERLVAIAEDINRDTQKRARTETVLKRAQELGIPVAGNDEAAQRNYIAGALSRTQRFSPDYSSGRVAALILAA